MGFLTDRVLANPTAITPTTLIHIVFTGDPSQNPAGSSYKAELNQLIPVFSGLTFTGGSGNCITDFYVSNIHSCSPLNINPLSEGDVYVGSASTLTVDLTNERVGIRINNPQYDFHVSGSSNQLYFDSTSFGGRYVLSGGTTGLPRIDVLGSPYLSNPEAGVSFGIRTWNDVTFTNYGKVGDSFLRAGDYANGINIINGPSGGLYEDYIRFYAGQNATGVSDIHIQGSGATRGYVGIGTENPSEKLEVIGKIKTDNFQITSSPTLGYVLTSTDNSGNASWQPISSLSGSSVISLTGVTTSAYTATTSYSYYGVEYTGNTSIEIPNATGIDGFTFRIKDERGTAATYPIIITPVTGTIDGNTSVTMAINYMSLTMVARNNNWWII